MPKNVTIETARKLAQETDSRAIIIIRWGTHMHVFTPQSQLE